MVGSGTVEVNMDMYDHHTASGSHRDHPAHGDSHASYHTEGFN